MMTNSDHQGRIIRIYNGSEGGIENSVPRITLWHYEACSMMTNGDPEGWIIRIYDECEDGIEKLIPTITIWHHEACE